MTEETQTDTPTPAPPSPISVQTVAAAAAASFLVGSAVTALSTIFYLGFVSEKGCAAFGERGSLTTPPAAHAPEEPAPPPAPAPKQAPKT